MAHANKVCRSIETPDGTRCVDIFRRPEGGFGYAEYRRDPEDGSGWHPTGYGSGTDFPSESAALAEARLRIIWLGPVLDDVSGR
jgi:hypothetical protein